VGRVILRDAHDTDLEALSALAYVSKQSWGYDDAFMAACREELSVRREHLGRHIVRVGEEAGTIVGFHGIEPNGARAELTWLFVAPRAMRRGVGHALLTDAIELARLRGILELVIEADPNAVAFYEHEGAVRIGEAASASIRGRTLPLLELAIG
jgi:GNAT superfamily N-acetyltransferase